MAHGRAETRLRHLGPLTTATLGYLYLTGGGVTGDEATAARWFDIADELDHPVDDWLDRLGLDRPRRQGA